MTRLIRTAHLALAALLLAAPTLTTRALAQDAGSNFKDTSMIRAPKGDRVAIYDFEDLECPACAHAFPIVHDAAAHYSIPIVRHDFPLNMHIWSRDAAITARYIQDTISPDAAEDYRRAVFAHQTSISSKEDLQAFTQKYFQDHGRAMPFVVDPTGRFGREVEADYELGQRIGLTQTPTIFVVTQKGWTQVKDISNLYSVIDTAKASAPPASTTVAGNSKMRHATTVQR